MGNTTGSSAPGANQAANTIFAGATSGVPAPPGFRAQVIADLPTNIPAVNMADAYNTDFLALQYLGSGIKGYVPGNMIYTLNNPQNLGTGIAYYIAVYVPKAATITGCAVFMQGGPGSYTATGYNGIALYGINVGTGLLTQVAASTNNATLWQAAQGILKVPFATPYSAQPAVYYVALLFSSSAIVTNPKAYFIQPTTVPAGMDFANTIRLQCNLNGQNSLPSTVNINTILSGQNQIIYNFLY